MKEKSKELKEKFMAEVASAWNLIEKEARTKYVPSSDTAAFVYDSDKPKNMIIIANLYREYDGRKRLIDKNLINYDLYNDFFFCGRGTADDLSQKILNKNKNYYIIDNSYFKGILNNQGSILDTAGRPETVRITKNSLHAKYKEIKKDRLDKFNICFQNKRGDKHILICPPTVLGARLLGIEDDWLHKTISYLKKYNIPIIIRPKNKEDQIIFYEKYSKENDIIFKYEYVTCDIFDLLDGCFLHAAPASVTSIEALYYGIPTITKEISPAHYASGEGINKEKVDKLFNFLSFHTFFMEEVKNGKALSILKKVSKDE
jgi:hypothetical protein